jgi:hypothetical protein
MQYITMKHEHLLYFLLALIPLFSCKKNINQDTATPSTLSNDLVLYMPFNNSLADSSGNAISSSSFGNISYGNNRYFEGGKSLTLTGTSRVEISSPRLDTLSRFSFYMEFMPYNSNSMVLLSRTRFNVTTNMKQSFSLMTNFNGGGTRYQMKRPGGCDDINTATAFGPEVKGSALPSINGWNYAAITYDGNTVRSYLNGNLVASSNQAGLNLCADAPLIIGSWFEGEPHYFQGRIDEFRVYKRALSENEITQLHQLRK